MKGFYDLEQSIKRLCKDYGYSLIVIGTLAVTLAISLFLFTILYSIEYKPLPEVEGSDNLAWGTMHTSGRAYVIGGLSNYNYQYFSQNQKTLTDFGRLEERGVTLSSSRFTEQLRGAATTSNMFSMLGVKPVLGRWLQKKDDLPGAQKSMVVSYQVWDTLFDKRTDVLNETLSLDGQVAKIVGVMPKGFGFPIRHEVWFVDSSVDLSINDHGGWNSVYGRVKPGVSMEEVDSEFKKLMTEMSTEFPNQYKGKDVDVISFTKRFSENRKFLLALLKVSAVAILIMGCFSVINLIIMRSLEKSKEVLIKTALGVPSVRIVTALLLETFWVCILALLLGIWICYLGVAYFGKDILTGPYWWQLEFEMPTIYSAIIVGVLVWAFTSLAPAWMARRQPTNQLLSSGRKGGTTNNLSLLMFGLSTTQILSAFILCVFTGVLVLGLLKIANADYGVPRKGYLIAEVKLSGEQYSSLEARNNYYSLFIDKASHISGIQGVGAINALPGSGGYLSTYASTERDLEISGGFPKANETPISTTYLELMEIDLLEGRNFTEADDQSAIQVAIINQSMADILYHGESAIGKQFQYDPEKSGELLTVVGVVPDVVSNNPLWYFSPASKDWRSQLYRPMSQMQPGWSSNKLVFKVSGNPYDFIEKVKSVAREIDSGIPLYQTESYEDNLTANESGFRRMIFTFAPAAIISIFISAIGIFTIARRVVLQRMPDIGVMRALGIPELIIGKKFFWIAVLQSFIVVAIGTLFSVLLLPSLPSSILITNTASTAMVCVACAILMSVIVIVASIAPILQSLSIQPRDAMNYGGSDTE